jgi:hypothetical protein
MNVAVVIQRLELAFLYLVELIVRRDAKDLLELGDEVFATLDLLRLTVDHYGYQGGVPAVLD